MNKKLLNIYPISYLNRPIAVRFINYRLKEHVYANRMYLKKGYYINKSLSKGRSSLFYKARQLKKQKLILDTWTRDGNICKNPR